MSYQTIVRHKPRMTEERLLSLTDELEAHGCRVRRDWLWTQLYVDLPSDLEAWLTAGGLEAVLAPYHDVVWSRRFKELPDTETLQNIPERVLG